jgi:putative endonuclease
LNPPQKFSSCSRGTAYEKSAEKYLIDNGFKILERNWRLGHKEIDLIAVKENVVVFVEVKGDRSGKYGHPAERVDRRKRDNLIAAAQQFIIERDLIGCDFRFDLITFLKGKLEYFPDAFQAE